VGLKDIFPDSSIEIFTMGSPKFLSEINFFLGDWLQKIFANEGLNAKEQSLFIFASTRFYITGHELGIGWVLAMHPYLIRVRIDENALGKI
jgi:hypothetical protein